MTHHLCYSPSCFSSTPIKSLTIVAAPLLFRGSARAPISLKNELWFGVRGEPIRSPAIVHIGSPYLHGMATTNLPTHGPGEFQGVAVAGTFDRLHQGHTLLLSTALSLVAREGRLVVGVSNGKLLFKKSLSELIEPFEFRLAMVEQYLKGLAESQGKSIVIECLEIEEANPQRAVQDPQLDCIVVSNETEVGGHTFNKSRVLIGLPPLKVVVVPLVPDGGSKGEKYSSSSFRRQSLGTFIQGVKGDRLVDGPLVTGPYMVGLTGGIAAGKSFVRELLRDKGAEVLDCDALGHLSYVPGTPTYQAMIAAFGHSIVSPVDRSIDRKILGSIVFTNPNQMNVLKTIVWSAVSHLVAEKREAMAEQGVDIFVVEAALLLEAHWEREVNEIWVVFTPQELLLQRLMSRNQINEEEANKRIRSQMSSAKRVALADVVIYNGWTKDETKEQVDKAWYLLLQRVNSKCAQQKVEDPLWFRWAGLMRRICVNEEVVKKWWTILKKAYSEPWRHYYTFKHLRALYSCYHEYAHFIAEPHIFQLAVFFHRIVQHPSGLTTNRNEILSATEFSKFALEAGLGIMDKEKVEACILLREQRVPDGDHVPGDLEYFLDCNLAVLGSKTEEYQEFKAQLQQEFKGYHNDLFETLVKNHLHGYMSGSDIYHSNVFRLKYLHAARANLCDKEAPLEAGSSCL